MIKFDIETRIPTKVRLRNKNRYLVEGWIFGNDRIKKLSVIVGDQEFKAEDTEIFRPDIINKYFNEDSGGFSAFSGFAVPVILGPVTQDVEKEIILKAAFKNGEKLSRKLGVVTLGPWIKTDYEISIPSFVSKNELLVICMATYNPKESQFEKQINSIMAQDYDNWICIVNDDCSDAQNKQFMRKILATDPRFTFIEQSENVGFYHNFERCLEYVPDYAKYVALADQDDYWYPNKLSECLKKLTGTTQLVYCDMRIVKEDGTVLSDTYWKNRVNYYESKDIDLLAIANTVTGAASVFRLDLLDRVLPFPPRYGNVYHDQWIAVLAASSGGIDYVNKPLYDYIQSDTNVIGHFDCTNMSLWEFIKNNYFNQYYLHNIKKLPLQAKIMSITPYTIQWAQNYYNFSYRDGKFISTIVQTALFRNLDKNLVPLLLRSSSLLGLIKIRVKTNSQHKTANNNELSLLFSKIIHNVYKLSLPLLRPLLSNIFLKQQLLLKSADTDDKFIVEFKRKFSCRQFAVVQKKHQINILLSSLDPTNFFGGYIGMFNFAKKFAEAGHAVRIIITDQSDICDSSLDKIQSHDQSLKQFLSNVEYCTCYNSEQILPIADDDIFVATAWWTAHIAHEAVSHTKYGKFIYLEQDYEPIFYEHGAYRVLAEMSYKFNFYPVFSTDILQQYFIESGVIPHDKAGEYFKNPVLNFNLDTTSLRTNREGKKKLLFYGRPQLHNARNLYPMGCLAIDMARELGHFMEDEWEVISIGGDIGEQTLPSGIKVKHIGKFDIQNYKELLPQHDLGLALMDSPHPSLLPIEMASAGLLVVTNTYGIKNQEYFTGISSNIAAVPPDYVSLAYALIDSAKKVDDLEKRIAGSKVNWPHDWDEALPVTVIEKAVKAIKGEE